MLDRALRQGDCANIQWALLLSDAVVFKGTVQDKHYRFEEDGPFWGYDDLHCRSKVRSC